MTTSKSMPSTVPENRLHVAVGVLFDEAGRVLIQQRAIEAHQGGLWEFPGGKVEPGELIVDALRRELHEELGIELADCRRQIAIRHDYPDRQVLLDVYRVSEFSGEITACESQPLQWVSVAGLSGYAMPEADAPIVKSLQLPENYIITPSVIDDVGAFVARFEALLKAGQRLFLYRVKKLSGITDEELVGRLQTLCSGYQARLLVHQQNPVNVSGCGVHLTEEGLGRWQRNDKQADVWVSASCHSLESLRQAELAGVDFAMLSPVEATQSHPDTPAIGWTAFCEQVSEVNLPVYALGGMSPGKLPVAWEHGAQGVAAISHWWK